MKPPARSVNTIRIDDLPSVQEYKDRTECDYDILGFFNNEKKELIGQKLESLGWKTTAGPVEKLYGEVWWLHPDGKVYWSSNAILTKNRHMVTLVFEGSQTNQVTNLKELNSAPEATHCAKCNRELKIVGLMNSIKYCPVCEV